MKNLEINKKLYPVLIIVVAFLIAGAWFAYNKYYLPSKSTETTEENNVAQTENVPEVVATVNGEEISREDYLALYQQMEQTYAMQGANVTDPQFKNQLQTQVVDQLIASFLLKEAAAEEGVVVEDSEVNEEIDLIIENTGGREAFEEELQAQGLTEETLRKNIREQFLVQNYIQTKLPEEQREVSNEETQVLYDEISAQQELPPIEDIREELKTEIIYREESEIVQGLINQLKSQAEIEIFI